MKTTKIIYNLVYNRKKLLNSLNTVGKALTILEHCWRTICKRPTSICRNCDSYPVTLTVTSVNVRVTG